MITRFSLWGQPDLWSENVQEDLEGRWARWMDVESYVQYALEHGYIPPVIVSTALHDILSAVDEKPVAGFDDKDLPEDDRELDLVDLMMSHNDLPAEDGG